MTYETPQWAITTYLEAKKGHEMCLKIPRSLGGAEVIARLTVPKIEYEKIVVAFQTTAEAAATYLKRAMAAESELSETKALLKRATTGDAHAVRNEMILKAIKDFDKSVKD